MNSSVLKPSVRLEHAARIGKYWSQRRSVPTAVRKSGRPLREVIQVYSGLDYSCHRRLKARQERREGDRFLQIPDLLPSPPPDYGA